LSCDAVPLSNNSGACGSQARPWGLVVDAEGFVSATQVHYQQLAQPKGARL
jgi:hypothetical protein